MKLVEVSNGRIFLVFALRFIRRPKDRASVFMQMSVSLQVKARVGWRGSLSSFYRVSIVSNPTHRINKRIDGFVTNYSCIVLYLKITDQLVLDLFLVCRVCYRHIQYLVRPCTHLTYPYKSQQSLASP
jgi:hypothetical protein